MALLRHNFRLTEIRTTLLRNASTSSHAPPPIGIVLMNMGGPSSLDGPVDGVGPFLHRLFSDKEIIRLGPLQHTLGPYIARKRTPRIIKQYSEIGGKSPIADWTAAQGAALLQQLQLRTAAQPGAAAVPFKVYTAFRYAPPLTEDALLQMKADGVQRAIAFSQYPQFSCTTTGSSLNHLWRESFRLGLDTQFKWSLIDRWHSHPGFLAAVARRVALGLAAFPADVREKVIVVFSAHSIPSMIVNRGDPYVKEVAATVAGVMAALRAGVDIGSGASNGDNKLISSIIETKKNPHVLAWQSKVGFLPWMGPSTSDVIHGLGKQGHKHVLLVPVAFTSDHVETLYEIDIEYRAEAEKCGISHFRRAPSLNDEPLLSSAMADIVLAHLSSGEVASPEYQLNCAGCTNPACRTVINPAGPYAKARDLNATCGVQPWPTAADIAALQKRTQACD